MNKTMGKSTGLAVAQNDIKYIKQGLDEVKAILVQQNKDYEDRYVTWDAFKPVRNIAYGLVSIIGAAMAYFIFYTKH